MQATKPKRILIGVAAGFVVLAGGVWALSMTLGNIHSLLFHDVPLEQWATQVNARDAAVSNQANAVLNTEIIPQLEDRMFHDTNDSIMRMKTVEMLNGLPGISYIYYEPAWARRKDAAESIGVFGPAAKVAIPALIQVLQGGDTNLYEPAIQVLGKIHGQPETVIPVLTKYLTDNDLNDDAATALGEYGSLARAAVPKIIPLLQADDDDARAAAAAALKKIDPGYTNWPTEATGGK